MVKAGRLEKQLEHQERNRRIVIERRGDRKESY
jgi:hypothetical protein